MARPASALSRSPPPSKTAAPSVVEVAAHLDSVLALEGCAAKAASEFRIVVLDLDRVALDARLADVEKAPGAPAPDYVGVTGPDVPGLQRQLLAPMATFLDGRLLWLAPLLGLRWTACGPL